MGQSHHIINRKKEKKASLFTYYMVIVGLVAPLSTIPQLMRVWTDRQVDGLSLITWISYSVFAGSWLVYGLKQKENPIILTQLFIFPMDLAIVLGILLFR